MPKKITTDSFIIESKKVHCDRFDYSFTKYVNAKTKVKNYLNTNYVLPLQKNISDIRSNINTDIRNTLNPGFSVGKQGTTLIKPTTSAARAIGSSVGVAAPKSGGGSSSQQKQKTGKSAEQVYQDNLSKQISDSYKAQINFLNQQEQNRGCSFLSRSRERFHLEKDHRLVGSLV
jgi:hypothetical protein